MDLALKRLQANELIRTQQQGLGRPIIATKFGEYQVVAVGNVLHYSRTWGYFADFLSDYLRGLLGADWGNAEIAKPLDERHPVLQWYDAYCRYQRGVEKKPDGSYEAKATGVVYCYLGLAYNLYLIQHNAELQRRLVARLKNREQFQGAYYELIVANCLIRAGFELSLEDESDVSSKHCEFAAVSKATRKRYWVEAKMRSVSGLLGKTNVDGASPTSKPTSRLSAHITDAFKKPAKDERIIFVDVNTGPLDKTTASNAEPRLLPKWIEAAGRQLDAREKDLKEGQRAYVFVTNMPFHRALDEETRGHAVLAHGLGISDFAKPGEYRLSEAWRRKQKHIDAHNIMDALKSYPHIPNTFDGSLPLSKQVSGNRIEIGGTYFFEDVGEKGMLGRVTTATISDAEKKMYVGVTTEDGPR